MSQVNKYFVYFRIMRQYPGEEVYEDAAEMTECKKKWEELLSIMTSVGFMELVKFYKEIIR